VTVFVIGVGALLLISLLIRIAIAMSNEMARQRVEEEALKKAMEIDRKRAEEMLKEQTRAQTINDLRNGKF